MEHQSELICDVSNGAFPMTWNDP